MKWHFNNLFLIADISCCRMSSGIGEDTFIWRLAASWYSVLPFQELWPHLCLLFQIPKLRVRSGP